MRTQTKQMPSRPNNLDVTAVRSNDGELSIREKARTDRLRLSLSALCTVCLMAGCVVVMFAPAGGEFIANWIGAAVVIATAGVTGHSHVWGRTKLISVGVESEKPDQMIEP